MEGRRKAGKRRFTARKPRARLPDQCVTYTGQVKLSKLRRESNQKSEFYPISQFAPQILSLGLLAKNVTLNIKLTK